MKYYLFLILSFIICPCVQPQEHYVFSPINSNDGLSENRVRGITQLPDGRLVITTEGLSNIYDGTSFKYIHTNEKYQYRLPSYLGFHHIYSESNGNMWIKNNNKLQYLDTNNELFILNIDSIFQTLGIKEHLADFFMDSEHNLWCPTTDNKLVHYNSKDKKTFVFLSDIYSLTSKENYLYDIATYKNQLFLFFKSGLMICFNIDTKEELYRDNPFKENQTNEYTRTLLVVQDKEYLYQVRNGENSIVHRYNIENRKWEIVMKTDFWINILSVDKKRNIWACGLLGIWNISEDLKNKEYISKLQLVDGKFINTEISTLFHDNKDGLWIGSLNRGLLYYHADRFKFKNIGHTLFESADIKDIRVQCFAEHENKILVATREGVFTYSKNNLKLSRYNLISSDTECTHLVKDSKERIWISTKNKGIFCISGNDVKHYPSPFKNIYNVYEGNDGTFYLCSEYGFGIFNEEKNSYQPITSSNTFQIIQSDKSTLLGISSSGMFLYDIEKKEMSVPMIYENEKSTLLRHSNNKYNCIYKDSRGLIWFGTQDGLNVWHKKDNYQRSFYTKNGLINNSIQSITEDKKGNIWVSTSNGISCIEVKNNEGIYQYTFNNFNRYDGVVNYEFLERSVFNSTDGHIYWGGIDGFNQFDVNKINIEQQLANPLFTNLKLFGTEIIQNEKYKGNIILKHPITNTDKIELDHDQNFISLDFSALNYINPTQTYYRFKLEGVDETWHETSSINGMGSASYTNLSPGVYTFRLYAANNNHKWNDECAEIKIVINPPFGKTTFAYIMYSITLLILLYFMLSLYINWSKKKLILQQKESLNQMKFQFFTNISHELRTPLTLIITPLDSILKKMEDSQLKFQLKNIYNNANNLLQLVNQLLDFRRLEIKGETLNLSYFNVNEFIETICISFEALVQNKNITFKWEHVKNNIYTYADKDKLHKIVNNLLSNAYKFTPEDGLITLMCNTSYLSKQDIEVFTISIKDTGYGIPEKEKEKIFTLFYQLKNNENTGSGIGLHLSQEYAHLHGGFIELESKLNKGSIFTVYIPLKLQTNDIKEKTLFVENKDKHTLKLLVVEDNNEFRAFLHNQLSEYYDVICASNGVEGLKKAKEELPDLVISDVMMPEMNGIELCQKIKNDIHISHTPVILLTAHSSDENQMKGYKAGADAYVSKPFNMDILLLRIHKLIEQHENRKNIFKKEIIISPEAITTTNLDEQLIKKALGCVEKNIDNPNYSVDLLSKDMNMDRTGLYRKLTSIIGQTPSTFIRSIRLKKSAQLLRQKLSVSEVSYLVGFGTVSYFGKCFQEEFGVKPSQYVEQNNEKILS